MATNFPAGLDAYANRSAGDEIITTHINNPQDAIEALEAKVGVNGSAVVASHDYKIDALETLVGNFITTGRTLWLYENVAPTGWTTQAVTDRVLAVKGGSYGGSGGVGAGTWTQPSHTHTGPSHTHTTPNHYHRLPIGLLNEPPHYYPTFDDDYQVACTENHKWVEDEDVDADNIDVTTCYKTHTDGSGTTGASGTGATGSSATASTWRPSAAVGILVKKN
jgi:hypothetical protein